MGMGAYDEDEHERRAEKTASVDVGSDHRSEYEGSLTYDDGDSAEEHLDRFREINDE